MTEGSPMTRSVTALASIVALACSTQLFACSTAPGLEEPASETASKSEAILNGSPVDGNKYAAVGALVYYLPEVGVLDVFCSGTLVAPRAIVTARHCTPDIDLALSSGLVPAIAFGADVFNPTQVVPITDYVAAPAAPGKEKGLLMDGGRDVAVAHLSTAPTGIKPIKLGEYKDSMLGSKFQIVGFGRYNFEGFYGQKFSGVATARATQGFWYRLLFNNDFDAFRSWYFSDSSMAQPSEAEAKEWWKSFKLEKNYELLAGGLPGEAVACYGDSGGPLLRGSHGCDMAIYGVSFAVEGTFSTLCGLGGGYLVFNRKMLDFIHDAI
ncbi:MAG TPA: trypsin-like serine protease [Polyangiaceae bacterium]|nr:trypsin-like serine protease [Polyangiaceae bacterium]